MVNHRDFIPVGVQLVHRLAIGAKLGDGVAVLVQLEDPLESGGIGGIGQGLAVWPQLVLVDDAAVGVGLRDDAVGHVGQGLGKVVELVLVVEEAPLDALPGVADVGAPAVDVIGGGLEGAGGKLHRLVGGDPPQAHHAGLLALGHLHLVVLGAGNGHLAVYLHVDGAIHVGGVVDIGVFGELVKELVALVVELVGPKVGVVLDGAGVVQNRLVQLGDLAA